MPLIFLTARSMKEDIVRGLKIGADDYITKPFDPEVLILRINNILKRVYSSANDEYKVSQTILKFNTLELICPGLKSSLHLKEAQLFKYFMINRNKVLAREDILNEIWGEDDYFLGRSMDVFISRLRKYVTNDKHLDIRTVRGTGFILEELSAGGEQIRRGCSGMYPELLLHCITSESLFIQYLFYLIVQIISAQVPGNYNSLIIEKEVGRN